MTRTSLGRADRGRTALRRWRRDDRRARSCAGASFGRCAGVTFTRRSGPWSSAARRPRCRGRRRVGRGRRRGQLRRGRRAAWRNDAGARRAASGRLRVRRGMATRMAADGFAGIIGCRRWRSWLGEAARRGRHMVAGGVEAGGERPGGWPAPAPGRGRTRSPRRTRPRTAHRSCLICEAPTFRPAHRLRRQDSAFPSACPVSGTTRG